MLRLIDIIAAIIILAWPLVAAVAWLTSQH